jgi:hypothetical protein
MGLLPLNLTPSYMKGRIKIILIPGFFKGGRVPRSLIYSNIMARFRNSVIYRGHIRAQ